MYVIHRLVPLIPTASIVLSDVFATEICTLWHLYHGGRRIFVWGDFWSSMHEVLCFFEPHSTLQPLHHTSTSRAVSALPICS